MLLLSLLVLANQREFSPMRQIFDSIVVILEGLASSWRWVDHRMPIKLNMDNAFDLVTQFSVKFYS